MHQTLVLETLGSIPMADKKKIGVVTCFPYCHLQVSQVTEFDLGVKLVTVNPDSSFGKNTMGHSSKCYIHRLKAIIPLVPEKKIFEDYLPYTVMAVILVM